MGYLHIENLAKNQSIRLFRECYALEKLHGTSAHVKFKDDRLTFYSGGEPYEKFKALFDADKLLEAFRALGQPEVTVYGEAYGGKQQGMAHTYGDKLKFCPFDVQIGELWLDVPNAEQVSHKLGLDFVPWSRVSTDLEALTAERDKPSRQAKKNGIMEDKLAEGIVCRPLVELRLNNGDRVICKYKNEKFSERASKKDTVVSEQELQVLADATQVAFEWVTPMRLEHVLDKLKTEKPFDMADIPVVIKAMEEDVRREAKGEIVESADVWRAVSRATVKLFKERLKKDLV